MRDRKHANMSSTVAGPVPSCIRATSRGWPPFGVDARKIGLEEDDGCQAASRRGPGPCVERYDDDDDDDAIANSEVPGRKPDKKPTARSAATNGSIAGQRSRRCMVPGVYSAAAAGARFLWCMRARASARSSAPAPVRPAFSLKNRRNARAPASP